MKEYKDNVKSILEQYKQYLDKLCNEVSNSHVQCRCTLNVNPGKAFSLTCHITPTERVYQTILINCATIGVPSSDAYVRILETSTLNSPAIQFTATIYIKSERKNEYILNIDDDYPKILQKIFNEMLNTYKS